MMKATAARNFVHMGAPYEKGAPVKLKDAELVKLAAAGLVETEDPVRSPPPQTPPAGKDDPRG